MKKLALGIVLGLAVGAGLMWWSAHRGATEAVEPSPAAKPEGSPIAKSPLHVDAAQRKAAGITVAAVRATALPAEISAFGRVLDPTPYVALAAESVTASATVVASEKELARVRRLHEEGGNASAQALETAEATAARDRAAAASADLRLLAGWGPELAKHARIEELAREFSQGAALVRVDALPGEPVPANIREASVSLLGSDQWLDAHLVGPAPVADQQVQGPSFLGVVRGHSLPAGASLRVRLPGNGPAQDVMIVAQSAVVYHQGSAWVYVLAQDEFTRRRIDLGRTVGDDVVVAGGLKPGEQVALAGAQQLLSAELVTGTPPDER